jgi:hypothetical protein
MECDHKISALFEIQLALKPDQFRRIFRGCIKVLRKASEEGAATAASLSDD